MNNKKQAAHLIANNLIDLDDTVEELLDLRDFRATVAAALEELRRRWQSALTRYDSQIGEKRRDALTFERWQELNERLKELDATITALGLQGAAFVAKADADNRLRIRAELARRMGWTVRDIAGVGSEPILVIEQCQSFPNDPGISLTLEPVPASFYSSGDVGALYWLPDPFTNAEDNRALVARLAATEARWKQFDDHLLTILSLQPLPYDTGLQRMLRQQVLTAPLETITLAAARALGIPEASE